MIENPNKIISINHDDDILLIGLCTTKYITIQQFYSIKSFEPSLAQNIFIALVLMGIFIFVVALIHILQ